jgi:mRNA degradation ribonuclease J1/J2
VSVAREEKFAGPAASAGLGEIATNMPVVELGCPIVIADAGVR